MRECVSCAKPAVCEMKRTESRDFVLNSQKCEDRLCSLQEQNIKQQCSNLHHVVTDVRNPRNNRVERVKSSEGPAHYRTWLFSYRPGSVRRLTVRLQTNATELKEHGPVCAPNDSTRYTDTHPAQKCPVPCRHK